MKQMLIIGVTFLLCACASINQMPPCAPWTPTPPSALAHPLTLDDCLALVMCNDVNVADWCARQKAADAELAAASVLPNPQLGFTLGDIGLPRADGQNPVTQELGLSYNFSKLITRASEIRAAELGQQKTAAEIAERRRQAAKAVGEAFYRILAQQQLVKVREQDRDAAGEMEYAAAVRAIVGIDTDIEADRAKAERMLAEKQLDLANRSLAINQMLFAFQLGADRPAWPTVTGKWPKVAATSKTKSKPTEKEIEAALALRTDYAKAYAARLQAEQDIVTERQRGILPGNVGTSGSGKHAPDGNSRSLGLSLPLPIFDRNQAGKGRAEAALAAAQTEEERIRREVIADLSETKSRRSLAGSQASRYTGPIVSLREELFNKSRGLFESGDITYIDMQESYRELLAARQTDLEAHRDAAIADWQHTVASGRCVIPGNPG